jgi:hypothetical protein
LEGPFGAFPPYELRPRRLGAAFFLCALHLCDGAKAGKRPSAARLIGRFAAVIRKISLRFSFPPIDKG